MNELGVSYVITPGEVSFNRKLCATDHILFWIINSLDATNNGCYATNEYLATKMNLKRQAITQSLKRLVKEGYLIIKGSKKRRRILIDLTYVIKHRHLIQKYNEPYQKQKKTNKVVKQPYNMPNGGSSNHPTNNYNKDLTLSKDSFAMDTAHGKQKVKTTRDVELIINHWNNISNKVFRQHKKDPDSKIYKRIIILCKKRLKENNKRKIIQAITDWYEIIIDPFSKINYNDSFVATKLDEFFKPDPKHVEGFSKQKSIPIEFISCFDEAIKGKDYLQTTYKSIPVIKDENIIKEFKKFWSNYLSEWNRPITKRFSHDKESLIIQISNKFMDFYEANKENFATLQTSPFYKPKKNPDHVLKLLFKMIVDKQDWELHYFHKKDFIEFEFKSWLGKNGYLKSQKKQRRRLRYKPG